MTSPCQTVFAEPILMFMSAFERSLAALPAPLGDVWSVSDLARLPSDGRRFEVLNGDLLVTPAPSVMHQWSAVALTTQLNLWCASHTQWTVLAPGAVRISETSSLEPDIAVFPVAMSSALTWETLPPPVLVVEVLSPSTRHRDRHAKRAAYLANGAAEVWLLDTDKRSVERWTSASEFPELHRDEITWTPTTTVPPLHLTNHAMFGVRTN